jgi:glycosyltransferase involved in cell wall biosynthesis
MYPISKPNKKIGKNTMFSSASVELNPNNPLIQQSINPTVSVTYSLIVPAYNEEKYITHTIDSLIAVKKHLSGRFNGEIIVVDNNSNDGTANLAKSKGAILVFEKVNCIARARNSGAKAASGKYLFFVDADTTVPLELIGEALHCLEGKNVCGGGTQITFDRRIPFSGKILLWTWNTIVKFYPMAAGSFLFCRKDAWQETGGFDEELYASEEISFSKKLRKWGRKNGKKFIVLNIPAVTSGRKFEWHSMSWIILNFAFFAIFPFGVRSKRLCHLWYKRKG